VARASIVRTDVAMLEGQALDAVRGFFFGVIDGFREPDRKFWRKFWRRITTMEPGELFNVEIVFPRSGPFHRRHMAIEAAVFDAQERFEDFDQFRIWLKVGAGWVDWCAGPKGGVVPIPRSISYSSADQREFEEYHEKVMSFLRGPHAPLFLWKHLGPQGSSEMMNLILKGFDE
jgi:hypothetical protein